MGALFLAGTASAVRRRCTACLRRCCIHVRFLSAALLALQCEKVGDGYVNHVDAHSAAPHVQRRKLLCEADLHEQDCDVLIAQIASMLEQPVPKDAAPHASWQDASSIGSAHVALHTHGALSCTHLSRAGFVLRSAVDMRHCLQLLVFTFPCRCLAQAITSSTAMLRAAGEGLVNADDASGSGADGNDVATSAGGVSVHAAAAAGLSTATARLQGGGNIGTVTLARQFAGAADFVFAPWGAEGAAADNAPVHAPAGMSVYDQHAIDEGSAQHAKPICSSVPSHSAGGRGIATDSAALDDVTNRVAHVTLGAMPTAAGASAASAVATAGASAASALCDNIDATAAGGSAGRRAMLPAAARSDAPASPVHASVPASQARAGARLVGAGRAIAAAVRAQQQWDAAAAALHECELRKRAHEVQQLLQAAQEERMWLIQAGTYEAVCREVGQPVCACARALAVFCNGASATDSEC